jgi:recombination protein RecA
MAFDKATGIWGIPRGRILEIFGPESSGKTTWTLAVVAAFQRAGLRAAFIDAEHALDPKWAGKIGVNIDDLLISQPDNGEMALDIAEILIDSEMADIIIVDSVAALTPKAEIEGDMGDSHMGLQARMMAQGLRKLNAKLKKNKVTVIFINQIREKIGVMFGSPETTPGGRALKFYASMRIDVRKFGTIKEGEVAVANNVRAKIIKNKLSPPFKEAELRLNFVGDVTGFDAAHSLLMTASLPTVGVIQKAGSWYNFNEIRLGLGESKSLEFLRANPEIFAEITEQVKTKIAPVFSSEEEEPEPDEAALIAEGEAEPVEG